jgi:isocitrate/isopropylmalate dehydrogenase
VTAEARRVVDALGLPLERLGETEAARSVMTALEAVCRDGARTCDIGGRAGTREVGDAVAREVQMQVA